jgi:dTMP kinase
MAPSSASPYEPGIRHTLAARGVRPADLQRADRTLSFALQLQRTYGGDLDAIVAAALLSGDRETGDATATDRDMLTTSGVPAAITDRTLRILAEGKQPAREDTTVEARILSDALILARLGASGILGAAFSVAASGGDEREVISDATRDIAQRIHALHFEQSRQYAVRAAAFERYVLAQLDQPATMEPPLPPYVVFEGLSGAGKSTQADLLARHFQREGESPVTLREPSPWYWHTRDDLGIGADDLVAQTLLYLMDRDRHSAPTIRQARDGGRPVVADRSYLSTLVYQSGAGWLAPENIVQLHAWAPQPTAVFVLDLPAERALARIGSRPSDAITSAQIEDETREQLRLHRKRFLALPTYFPWVTILDATLDPEVLHARVWARLTEKV